MLAVGGGLVVVAADRTSDLGSGELEGKAKPAADDGALEATQGHY